MRFIIDFSKSIKHDFNVAYIEEEMYFDTFPAIESPFSLSMKYVQIGFNEYICSIWGLCPKNIWQHVQLNTPDFQLGEIRIKGDFVPGVSCCLLENPSINYDIKTNWLCIGEYIELNADCINIQFLNNACVTILNNKIVSLWINPNYMNTYPDA